MGANGWERILSVIKLSHIFLGKKSSRVIALIFILSLPSSPAFAKTYKSSIPPKNLTFTGKWDGPVTAVLLSVHFFDAKTGWAVGEGGTVIRTTDGGTTWQKQESPVTAWLFSVHFFDTKTGWAVGWDGTVIRTTDGGTTWKKQESPVTAHLDSVHFFDAKTGWAVGEGGTVIRTTDGGTT